MKSFIEIAKEKAEESFIKEQESNPDLYPEVFKPLFISFYIEGYLEGCSDTNEVALGRLDNLSNDLP